MYKQNRKLLTISGIGALVLATGACQQQPPPEDASSTPPPTRPKQTSANTTAGTAGNGSGSGAPVRPQRPGNGRDPFAAGGAKGPKGAAPTAAATPVTHAGRRKDPFYVDWTQPRPVPNIFEEVEPIRLASDFVPTPPPKPYEVRETPQMRVSGILTGDGVFAIVESPNIDRGAAVVKPGSTLDIGVEGQTKRTYKVVSITKDMVKLRSQVGNVIYTQEVPLSDVSVGTPARGFAGGPGGGVGGGPAGIGPGGSSGGRPGLRPGGGFGGGPGFRPGGKGGGNE